MKEVLKALQELNVCWKKIGHYNMKCRWVPCIPGHHEGMVNHMQSNHYFGDEPTIIENDGVARLPNVVKFEVQVSYTSHHSFGYCCNLPQTLEPMSLYIFGKNLSHFRYIDDGLLL